MKGEKLEVTRGSGNVFRDLGYENADREQFKAILAAEIIRALDREHLTVRASFSRNHPRHAPASKISIQLSRVRSCFSVLCNPSAPAGRPFTFLGCSFTSVYLAVLGPPSVPAPQPQCCSKCNIGDGLGLKAQSAHE